MFCPGCGEKNNIEQKFCRSCGLNLEQTSLSVREQSVTRQADLERQEQSLEKFGNVVFTGFGIVVGVAVLGMIYAVLTRFILTGDAPLVGIVFIAFILFAALALTYVIRRESLKEKRAKLTRTATPTAEPSAPTGKLMDGANFEPVPSVTENTTTLLDRSSK